MKYKKGDYATFCGRLCRVAYDQISDSVLYSYVNNADYEIYVCMGSSLCTPSVIQLLGRL